jgi:hypothetical protein
MIFFSFSSIVYAQNPTLINLPENSWYSAPNTTMEQVFPPYNEAFWGTGGPSMVIEAWGGGTYDPIGNRMILWGGGHNDYYGNEIYAFNIDSLKWVRLTEPTMNWADGEDPNSDGTPNGRHTYNGLAFIAHANRFFASGGALNHTTGSCGADLTWTFDMSNNQWRNMQPSGNHTTQCGNGCAYDPDLNKVYYGDVQGLYAYDYADNSWEKLNSDHFYYQTMVVDPKRRLLVIIGAGEIFAYDIDAQNFNQVNWQTSGDTDILDAENPGVAYDRKADRIVAWNGGAVYSLNIDTKVWSSRNPTGSPGGTTTVGIFGRWQYVPLNNIFVAIVGAALNVHFYKNTPGALNGSNPVEQSLVAVPSAFRLLGSYPNPFNPVTHISFSLPSIAEVTLNVYDVTGQLAQSVLAREHLTEGKHTFSFDASNLPSGIYFSRVSTSSGWIASGKMVLVK